MAAKRNLTPVELRELAEERLADAKALFAAERYEGAFYLSGYAVEMALKYKACETLDWDEYFTEDYKVLKTHKFDELLRFSGMLKQKNSLFLAEWLVITKWDSVIRYSSKKQETGDVKLMIEATESLLGKLWSK